MRGNLYLTLLLLAITPFGWGWSSFRARVGGQQAAFYQSSNPKVELRTTRNINQHQSEECYLFAFIGALEVSNRNAWKRSTSPEISPEYLLAQKLLAWGYDVMAHGRALDDSFYFLHGGDVHHAMKLSIDQGLLPQELFKPMRPLDQWDFNALYQDVREIAKEGRSQLARAKDSSAREEVLQFFNQKLMDRIAQDAGEMPARFAWAGRNWTNQSFQRAFGIKSGSHIFMTYPKGAWDMGDPWDLRRSVVELVKTFRGAFNYRQASWRQIWKYVTESIDQGLPTLLSMKWGGSYHVLNAVGYELSPQGELVSFKLKNSWDVSYGDRGHAYFFVPDLERNVTSAWGFQAP
jgi:hypothetical protein